MTVPIPVLVIDSVTNQISKDYPTLQSSSKLKLFQVCCEMWLFILEEHETEKSKKEKEFGDSKIDNIYANISREQFQKFQIKLNGKVFQYTQIKNLLIKSNLIEDNSKYKVGEFSKSYRPNPENKYSTYQLVDLDFKLFLKNENIIENLILENPKHAKLIKDLYLAKINLSTLLTDLQSRLGKPYTTKSNKWNTKSWDVILDDKRLMELMIKAIKINLGIHFFKEADTGRIYSSIANLPKLCLPHLTLNGNAVAEVDAVNCQPLIISSFLNNEQYKQDCEAGIYYEKMAAHFSINRDEFKLLNLSKILFNNTKIDSKLMSKIDEVYPGLAEEINKYKANSKEEAETMDRKQLLWNRLQSIEAAIFIKVAKSLPYPVLTRHDSIIVSSEYKVKIEKALTREFKKYDLNVKFK